MWSEVREKLDLSIEAVKAMKKYGEKAAQTERDYHVIKAKKALELKDTGMPATLINLVVVGDPEVAEAKFQRDVAEVMYKTAQELVNVRKIETKCENEQLAREWNG